MQFLFISRFIRIPSLLALFVFTAFSQVNVLTNRYNQARTAANLNESQLTTANVNTSTFGKLGSYSVDGVIYAQPLYVQGVNVNGVQHNVLYIGTMHDVLYAFDADNVGSLPLWTLDFRNLAAGISPAPVRLGMGDGSNASVADTFGIFGTPVIDLPNNHIFLVTHTLESGTECFRLREVDIRTGALLASTLISGAVPATGSAASVTFVPPKFGQRGALELVNGQIWVDFGSRPTGDTLKPWQGWLMTYSSSTLAQTGVFATSRTSGNSIFQMGAGPAVDANGNLYYLTGNGGAYDGVTEFPESLIKLSFGTSLTLNDSFTPDSSSSGIENYIFMNQYDLDLGCNGPILIPGTDLITFGSKTADVYLLHTGNLGQLTPNDTQLAQFFHVGASHDYTNDLSDRIIGMAYWQNSSGGTLYVWPGEDSLHTYTLSAANSTYTPSYVGSYNLPGEPSTALSLSANGSNPGTGILWAPIMNLPQQDNTVGQPGILHAYNASNPAQELWNSNMAASDNMGTLPKFLPAVVANGKVYMANSAVIGDYGAGSVTVFGLKVNATNHSGPYSTLTSPANSTVFTAGSTITLAANIYASTKIAKVTFMDGTSVLGTFTSGVQGAYTFAWTGASAGSHTLTAVVVDQTGAVATSFASTITVVASQLVSISAVPASISIRPGSSVNTQLTVTPVNGYSGTASVLTISGLPGGVSSLWSNSGNTFTLTLSASSTAALATSNLTVTAGANGGIVSSFVLPLTVSSSAPFMPGTNLVSLPIPAGAILGTPVIFTEGVPSSSLPSPDYALTATTCTGAVTGTCTVSIQFTPQFVGLRRGAVQLRSSSNTVLSTAYFYGTGTGTVSQSAWAAGVALNVYKKGSSRGVAVDGAGNVFVLDSWANQVFKITPGGGTPAAVPFGLSLSSPFGLALDAVGNLYVADAGNNRIVELPYGGSSAIALNLTGLIFPEGVAVDGAGNLFIANTRGAAISGNGSVIEVAAGSGIQSTVLASGLSYPSAVALDAAGDLFIADWGNNRVLELPVSGPPVSFGSGVSNASAVAVDGFGDVFIADENNNRIVEVPATSGPQITIASGLVNPYGLALDAQGDVFIANAGSATAAGGLVEVLNTTAIPTQAVVFGGIATQQAGTTLALTASASSGLTVSYTSTTNSVCTVSGTTVTLLTAGTCTIIASQAGNSIYPAAASVSQSFAVAGVVQTIILPFTIPNGAAVGKPVVFTEGVPSSSLLSPDFTLLSSNCAGASATCTVNIKFTPQAAGLRRGAVELVSTANAILSTSYFYANGNGSVSPTAWAPAALKTVYKNGSAHGVAIDGAGNVFVLDSWANQVYKVVPNGTPTLVPLGLTLSSPFGLALDAAGNLYIADAGNNRIVELPYGSNSAAALNVTGLSFPEGVAVDGLGNLFIANTRGIGSSGNGTVIEVAAGSAVQTTLLAAGLSYPSNIALDAAGDLFIADWGNNRVLELPVGGSPLSFGTGLANASAVAVDGAGDVFITDQGHNQLIELPATASGPGSGSPVTVATGLVAPYGLALDGQANVFIVNAGNSTTAGGVVELPNASSTPH